MCANKKETLVYQCNNKICNNFGNILQMSKGSNFSQKFPFFDWLKITYLLAGDSLQLDIEDSIPYHRNTISKIVQTHKTNVHIFESNFRPKVWLTNCFLNTMKL